MHRDQGQSSQQTVAEQLARSSVRSVAATLTGKGKGVVAGTVAQAVNSRTTHTIERPTTFKLRLLRGYNYRACLLLTNAVSNCCQEFGTAYDCIASEIPSKPSSWMSGTTSRLLFQLWPGYPYGILSYEQVL